MKFSLLGVGFFLILFFLGIFVKTTYNLPDDPVLKKRVRGAYSNYSPIDDPMKYPAFYYTYSIHIVKDHCEIPIDSNAGRKLGVYRDYVIATYHKTFFGITLRTLSHDCGGFGKRIYWRKPKNIWPNVEDLD